ncbi:SDH family Clp fold serine proteinase [Burkholderia ubonensis]|uniref:SDH family Clp fold serine proteinase n=1 Tax=Burkholderia ubonensis TaxID=101571 RepID=UPI0009B4D973|nr:hypothetical protein [Burkholderia ubonensis]
MAEQTEKDPHKRRIDVFNTAKAVAEALDCDIALISGGIERGTDSQFILSVRNNKKHPNLLLFMVTPGGDAHAAYRIARCAQDQYEKFYVFVSGYCKSAGTLCVLGANEIIMSDQGELGPLDVQVMKRDELGEMSSGLVIGEALERLQRQAFSMFEEYFLQIKRRSGGTVTFKTATETAAKIVTGLFEPIYSQIDPSLIGDVERSMTIAKDYGRRLRVKSENFTDETLELLVESYPAHGFVIDRREASELFANVRAPTHNEEKLARLLSPLSRVPSDEDCVMFVYPDSECEQLIADRSENDSESQAEVNEAGASDVSPEDRTGGNGRDLETPKGTTLIDAAANEDGAADGTNG